MEYTLEDILNHWKRIEPAYKTRKRMVLDPRNYLLAIAYYKFKIPETKLNKMFDMDRSSVNHNKKIPYDLLRIKESVFMRHTIEVRQLFPFEFPSTNKEELLDERYIRKFSYTVNFDKKTYHKIKAYSKVKELDPRTALRDLIQKALALWEE